MKNATLILVSLLPTLWATAACYSYRAVPVADVAEGSRVRARLTMPEAQRVGEILGAENGTAFEGRFVEQATSAEYAFEFPIRGVQQRIYNRVNVPMSDILEIEERQFSTWRTAGLVGILATGTALALLDVFDLGPESPGEEPPPIDEAVIPILRLRF